MHLITKTSKHLPSLLVLQNCIVSSATPCAASTDRIDTDSMKNGNRSHYKHLLKSLIMLMLLLSGNVQPNPGPVANMTCLQTHVEFLNRSGIDFVHMNV